MCPVLGPVSCDPKPELCTPALPRPLLRPSPCPGLAMPLPKSALATVPLIPFAPPDPLPCPAPIGRSNEPAAGAISLPFVLLFALGFSPFGSPKPPVCTFAIGAFTVGVTELPWNCPVLISTGRAPLLAVLWLARQE